ncbi:MAG: ATP-binding protein [Paludibacteraceae bacterium]|nr:ATP-binding protein [Paludibacteraceae bacterium]
MESKYPPYQLSSAEQTKFDDFEKSFSKIISGLLAKDKFQTIRVEHSVSTVLGDGKDKFIYSTNASSETNGSVEFVSSVKSVFAICDTSFLPKDCSICIVLNFTEGKAPDEKKNESPTKDATPTFIPIKPKYTFDQIILPDETKKEIFNALSVIENRKLIYEDWGFGEVEPTPRSIINFYGAPGTGKSMCAHAIASKMDKPLLALNYADIESKYVGEAAKNLKKAFETASELGAVMFFDEADSFLGKRIENVTQGADQALNSLRSQMLIYLENFSGVVIFATNLVTNFDQAFNSRILSHIKFELPNKEARAAIIAKMIPAKVPTDHKFTEDEYLEASELVDGLSGREIKTAIQTMLLNEAAAHGKEAIFTIDILKDALKAKKESIEKLKAEEQLRLKEKISKKLQEKSMENKAIEEQADEQSAEKERSENSESKDPDGESESFSLPKQEEPIP